MIILTKYLFFLQKQTKPQENCKQNSFCLFRKTSFICKQKITPFQFSQNMLSKNEKVVKTRWNIFKTSKTKRETEVAAPHGGKILKMSKIKKWTFHYPNHPRKYESSNSIFIKPVVIGQICKNTQTFTHLDVICCNFGTRPKNPNFLHFLSPYTWDSKRKTF